MNLFPFLSFNFTIKVKVFWAGIAIGILLMELVVHIKLAFKHSDTLLGNCYIHYVSM